MARSEWPEVFVHLLPSMIPPGALRGGVAIVVDVLRATTFMVRALGGIDAIIPCAEIEEARAVASKLPPAGPYWRASAKVCQFPGSTSAIRLLCSTR